MSFSFTQQKYSPTQVSVPGNIAPPLGLSPFTADNGPGEEDPEDLQ